MRNQRKRRSSAGGPFARVLMHVACAWFVRDTFKQVSESVPVVARCMLYRIARRIVATVRCTVVRSSDGKLRSFGDTTAVVVLRTFARTPSEAGSESTRMAGRAQRIRLRMAALRQSAARAGVNAPRPPPRKQGWATNHGGEHYQLARLWVRIRKAECRLSRKSDS